jgi:hypothetical protein
VAAWPKLFQNLRASRTTELAAEYPAHVAAYWLGHSTLVASKHYWQVTDADYERANVQPTGVAQQNAQQMGSVGPVSATHEPQRAEARKARKTREKWE